MRPPGFPKPCGFESKDRSWLISNVRNLRYRTQSSGCEGPILLVGSSLWDIKCHPSILVDRIDRLPEQEIEIQRTFWRRLFGAG